MKWCAEGHEIDAIEMAATGLRLPCGCPLTSAQARRDEGVDALPLTTPVGEIVVSALDALQGREGLDRDEAYLLARLEQADDPTAALREAVDSTEAHEHGFTHVPVANEIRTLLEGDWSEPVQLRIENGEMVLRNVDRQL